MFSSFRLSPALHSADPATVTPLKANLHSLGLGRQRHGVAHLFSTLPEFGLTCDCLPALRAESAVFDGCWCPIPSKLSGTIRNSQLCKAITSKFPRKAASKDPSAQKATELGKFNFVASLPPSGAQAGQLDSLRCSSRTPKNEAECNLRALCKRRRSLR